MYTAKRHGHDASSRRGPASSATGIQSPSRGMPRACMADKNPPTLQAGQTGDLYANCIAICEFEPSHGQGIDYSCPHYF
jgi:hypothetical protein